MTRHAQATRMLFIIGLMWAAFTIGSTPPVGAATPVTDANVAELAASATTPADHEALAAYFRAQAAAAGDKVKMHEEMLSKATKRTLGKHWDTWQRHCKGLIQRYKDIQKEAEGLAAVQEKLAKKASE